MNISKVVADNLCVSCGICAGVCPKKCISSTYRNGRYLPTVDENSCTNCGLCHGVCPGKATDYPKLCKLNGESDTANILFGKSKICLAAQTKNEKILAQSASGGVVTTLVMNLLHKKIYDAAFLVDTYTHDEEIFSAKYTADSDFGATPKSRYLTVNHSRAVDYMLRHRDEKIIFVGTACFMQGLLNIIDRFKLRRENYFLLGLFCDKTMNYGVWNYFKELCGASEPLRELFFRTKEPNGWPGDVGLVTERRKFFLPRQARMQMKDFFALERCLYCLDKLNRFADISCGDNYTQIDLPASMNPSKGTSNVIVRTDRGVEVFAKFADEFYFCEVPAVEIAKSQQINIRANNFIYGEYKSAEVGYPVNVTDANFSCAMREIPIHRQIYETLLGRQKIGNEKKFPAVAADITEKIFAKTFGLSH